MNNTITTKYVFVFELLEDLVNLGPLHTDLIICSTRDEFLSQIIPGLRPNSDDSETMPPPEQEGDARDQGEALTNSNHAFLSPTLDLVNASQCITLVFCPSIPILRGYFAGYAAVPLSKPSQIVILNLLALHHGSSEFTLQGLSQTFATIVSTTARVKQSVQLIECKDINDAHDMGHGSTLWDARVPLLSASIKIGEGGARWGRRTVTVAKIASKWFRVQEAAEHRNRRRVHGLEVADSKDEMLV